VEPKTLKDVVFPIVMKDFVIYRNDSVISAKSEERAVKTWENVDDVDKWLKDLRNGDL
jgi:hypothetical protein